MHGTALTERQASILRCIIQEYVGGGRAVASQALIERYPLNVSSATVRNEMAALERMGLIQQMHTSAGRVPTDKGYRYYVEHFAADSALPVHDQVMIRHQFGQVESHLDRWMELAASVLSEFTRNVSLVTSPRTSVPRLRHFELLSLQERAALLILVTQESSVHQALMHLSEPMSQAELSLIADRLNDLLRDSSAAEAETLIGDLHGAAKVVAERVVRMLQSAQTSGGAELHYNGLEHALQQPEFSSSQASAQLFELLRGGALLSELLPQVSAPTAERPEENVYIFIGDENASQGLRPFGIVVATYGVDAEVTGLLGILGPRRMPYERTISSVRYVASLMSDLMRDLYRA
ncbi:MAG: heat-inducible transcription repressor HrcA [Chloroflexi bacterium]|nr:MAG: heat-inducible transcription repressor HrcA [Chloroflexota bacterium]